MLMWIYTIVGLVAILGCEYVLSSEVRFERDYDYDGAGDSYYVKVNIDDAWHFVCWDDYWSDMQYQDTSSWCLPMDMTFGSPYTGDDYPGEARLRLDCNPENKRIQDCHVASKKLEYCVNQGHVRMQCMDPVSQWSKMQPLAGILVGLCVAFGVLWIISCIGCCCVACCRKGNNGQKGNISATAPQQQQQQQQPQQIQYYPQQQQQQPGVYVVQSQPGQQAPPPQGFYPPAQAPYVTPMAPTTAPYPQAQASAPIASPPPYVSAVGELKA